MYVYGISNISYSSFLYENDILNADTWYFKNSYHWYKDFYNRYQRTPGSPAYGYWMNKL